MHSQLLIRRRVVLATDTFAEIVVWSVDPPVTPCTHPYRYRLAYVVDGQCVLRYDNERGKGDHRHLGSRALPYPFTTPQQLLTDFGADIERWNHEHGRA